MVSNVNPLPANSGLTVVIPADFGVVLSSMTLQGVNIQTDPVYTFADSTRTLSISSFNTAYLQERSFFYISIASVINPGKTEPTASFSVSLADNNGRQVEAVTEGVTFSPIAGGFASASLKASDTVINRESVKFTFTITPDAPFLTGVTLKIVFPPELKLSQFATCSEATGEMDLSQARWSVEFNKNLLIKNAFPNGFAQTGPPRPFSFTVSGVTNPPTVAPTNPF